MRSGLPAVNSCDVIIARQWWYDILLEHESEHDYELTLVALLVQYPLARGLQFHIKWVCRTYFESQLLALIARHAEGLSSLLEQDSIQGDDVRRYAELGMLPGTSGIGKVRVILFCLRCVCVCV